MRKKHFLIHEKIPAVLRGNHSEHVIIAVHGAMSNKEDDVIRILAEKAVKKGYQVLSFDLPEHGDRKQEKTRCKADICANELQEVLEFAKIISDKQSLFACSMGVYFSLLAYQKEDLQNAWFLSPLPDMEKMIDGMMKAFHVNETMLQEQKEIDTPIGQKLYWDYYCYVKEHPIASWNAKTYILYGEKDNQIAFETVKNFSDTFHCDLVTYDDGEHYFHTEEQLAFFKEWLAEHMENEKEISFHSIGTIHSAFKLKENVPKQGTEDMTNIGVIDLDSQYLEGMADMKVGEQYLLLFYFDQVENYKLTVKVRGTGPMKGLFSTRAPYRPNAIGVSKISITKIENNKIWFQGVDMLDGTPVLDIKPL